MPHKTAVFLVLMLTAATVRPIACAWWCAPGETVDASCHEKASTDVAQLGTGSTCDVDVLDTTATMTKTASLERVVFIPVPPSHGGGDLSSYTNRLAALPLGRLTPATAQRPTVLRI